MLLPPGAGVRSPSDGMGVRGAHLLVAARNTRRATVKSLRASTLGPVRSLRARPVIYCDPSRRWLRFAIDILREPRSPWACTAANHTPDTVLGSVQRRKVCDYVVALGVVLQARVDH